MGFALNVEYKNSNSSGKIGKLTNSKKYMSPIFKWTRDERYIIEELKNHIPDKFSSYWDAYLGGGALLFKMQPPKAVVNVCDPELYNIYKVIKYDVSSLMKELKNYKNEKEYYHYMKKRKADSLSSIEKAARNIYLSKTCFNGFFRKDENGEFDVPFGSYKNSKVLNKITLNGISRYLRGNDVKLTSRKFESLAERISCGAFVYIAPENNFESQNVCDFQRVARLKMTCDKLNSRGVKFLISHSYKEILDDAFGNYEILKFDANKNIRPVGSKRQYGQEMIIKNY